MSAVRRIHQHQASAGGHASALNSMRSTQFEDGLRGLGISEKGLKQSCAKYLWYLLPQASGALACSSYVRRKAVPWIRSFRLDFAANTKLKGVSHIGYKKVVFHLWHFRP